MRRTLLFIVGLFGAFGVHNAFAQHSMMPSPTHVAQSSGLWNSAGTWEGGAVPGSPEDNVRIPDGVSVDLDAGSSIRVGHIHVQGVLGVEDPGPGAEISLGCLSLIVDGPNAEFVVGREDSPHTGSFRLELWGTNVTQDIAGFGTKVLGSQNSGVISLHGVSVDPYTELAETAKPGDTSISVFSDGSNGWEIGDRIWIAPTYGPVRGGRRGWDQAEERTITGIEEAGGRGTPGTRIISFDTPLEHEHVSREMTSTRTLEPAKEWVYRTRGHVALLNRNIKITGMNPGSQGFGGHVMIMGQHDMDGMTMSPHGAGVAMIENVEFTNMGQKSLLARYPFHWHMLAFDGEGQYFRNNVVYKSFNRAITIHGSHRTEVSNNVAIDHLGHGIFLEDGAEIENVITGNLVALTTRPAQGDEVLISDNQFGDGGNNNGSPSAFWITHPKNIFDDNIVAGTHGAAYWFVFNSRPTGLSRDDPRLSNLNGRWSGLTSFKNNHAYATEMAFDVNDRVNPNSTAVQTNHPWNPPGKQVLDGFIMWANDVALYTGLGTGENEVIFDNNQMIGNYLHTRFAAYHHVENSLFVADTPDNLYPGLTIGVQLYDGAGRFHNNHWVDFRNGVGRLAVNGGGTGPRANWIFSGNSYNHSGFAEMSLGAGGSSGGYGMKSLKDLDGTLGGHPQTTLATRHEILALGEGLSVPSNFINVRISESDLCLVDMSADTFDSPVLTRVDRTTNERISFTTQNAGNRSSRRVFQPIVNNPNIEYEVTEITSESFRMRWRDTTRDDSVVWIFPDFGRTAYPSSGVEVVNSIEALRNADQTSFYLDGSTVYFKFVGTNLSRSNTETHLIHRDGVDGDFGSDLNTLIPANFFSEESDPDNDDRIFAEGLDHVTAIQNATWISFHDFDFETGVGSIDVSAATNKSGGTIEVRVGSPTGPVLGTVRVTDTGGMQNYQNFSSPLFSTTGLQDLYLVFIGRGSDMFNLQSFTINRLDQDTLITDVEAADFDEQSDPNNNNRIRNQGDHVSHTRDGTWIRFNSVDFQTGAGRIDVTAAARHVDNPGLIEVRLGSQTGTLVATVDVKSTGGSTVWETFSSPLSRGASGVHDLYLFFIDGFFNVRDFQIHLSTWDVSVAASPESGGAAVGSGSYVTGSEFQVQATPASGFRFGGWTGAAGISDPSSRTTTVAATRNMVLDANFIRLWSLHVLSDDASRGTVSGSGTFDEGEPVSISASPAPGFRFDKWSGAEVGDSSSPETSIVLTENTQVSASFLIDASEGYNLFAEERFGDETDIERIGPMADFSGNGIPNFLEYALVLDPESPEDRQPVRALEKIQHDGKSFLGVEFLARNNDPGITYSAKVSSDLVDWESVVLSFDGTDWISDDPEVIAVHSSQDDGENISRIVLRAGVAAEDAPSRFIRITVSTP